MGGVFGEHEYGGPRRKRYVDVVTLTSADGVVTPLRIDFDERRHFAVDKVLECRQAHAARTGGCGLRYTVRVSGRTTWLWFDSYRRRWFVEEKVAPSPALA